MHRFAIGVGSYVVQLVVAISPPAVTLRYRYVYCNTNVNVTNNPLHVTTEDVRFLWCGPLP